MKKNLKKYLLILSILIGTNLNSNAHGQNTDFQSWLLVTKNFELNDKLFIYTEAQARQGNDFRRFERILLRPALGYKLNENLDLFLGYAWTPTFFNSSYRRNFREEHRIWQQAIYKHSFLDINWLHRFRQEQRFLQSASNVANRSRYLLKGSYNLKANYGLTAYNELFVSLNTVRNGPKAGFDRNRLFAGFFYTKDDARYELGYVGEYGRRFGDTDRVINSLFLGANF